ncbi:MAG: LysM peptidoglycan-binding domain-containing protein [Ignavibacteria bacterium]|nr:LysM peptidoglycan-binding domain-containing protein [Ignavibacteria bacterium]
MNIDIEDSSGNFVLKNCEFPENHYFLGSGDPDSEFRIFIKQEALKRIEDHLLSDVNNELGGVMVGEICINSNNKKFILINDLIIAMHSNSSLSRLTFTHETWDYINEVMERDFPESKILGWYHSHPGHTVFLSNYDLFIHENFFNLEYMVAYVFDPTIKERGFFVWENDKVEKSNGFFVFDYNEAEFNELIKLNPSDDLINPVEVNTELEKSKYKIELNNKALVILNVLILLILLLMIYNFYEINKLSEIKEDYQRDLSYIKEDTKKLNERLNSYILETELRTKAPLKNEIPKSEPVKEKISESDDKSEQSSTGKSDSDKKTDSTVKDVSTENTKKYTVKSGDTLEKISMTQYKSRAGIDYIMKINNLKSKSDIKIGQVLNIPEKIE